MTDKQAEKIAYALRRISSGDQSGPEGFEALCMAIAGEGTPGHDSLAAALDRIADAIERLAKAVELKGL
jgi:hypothetical protein